MSVCVCVCERENGVYFSAVCIIAVYIFFDMCEKCDNVLERM